MYNIPYNNIYSSQFNIDRIDNQIAELNKIKNQYQQQIQQPQNPTNLTQNFQLAPINREVIRYANSIEDVKRDTVIGDTPYFSRDMNIVWIKNIKGDIKTYELNEIVQKDEKDIQIDLLQAQLNELKGMIKNAKSNNVLLITMNSHITCSKYRVIYDTFDCRNRESEYVWLVR